MEKPTKTTKRNFMKDYMIIKRRFKLMTRTLILLIIALLLLVLNLLMLGIFGSTYLARRFFQFLGLVNVRNQHKMLEIKGADSCSQNTPRRRVCVIGCGPSGLVAVKECIEKGLEVVAYDAYQDIGGVFSCAYEGGLLTTSNFFTAYSSFPCDVADLPPRFWSFAEYIEYLRKFVSHFHLQTSLKLGYKVTTVTDIGNNKWEVKVTKWSTKEESSSIFDYIIVCSGSNQNPALPRWAIESSFRGKIQHSSEYHTAKDLAGKRVLIVGMGESASDIAFNVSQVASHVCLIARSGPGVVIPRYHAGKPSDLDTTRIYHSLPRRLARLTLTWWRLKVWLESFYNITEDDELEQHLAKVNFSRYHWLYRYGTKSANFVLSVTQNGGHYMETSIRELDKSGAIMENGLRYDCDVIILCTGFKGGCPFLPPELGSLNYRCDLWKKCIHPKYGKRISFIGFCRPSIGAIPPISEMQARFVSLALADRIKLLSETEMKKTIEEEKAYEEWLFPYDFKRVSSICSYMETMTSWARMLNCDVQYLKLLVRDPFLLYSVVFGPIIPAQYRLFGEGSDYDKARKSLGISGIRPLVPSLYTSLVLLFAAVLSNFGLCDPPIAFPLP